MKWPRVFGSIPTLKDINLLCWLFLFTLAVPLFIAHSGREQVVVADFVQVYSLGRILNEYPAKELYNYQLQQKLSSEVHPLRERLYGPSPYPPYAAILFRPLSRMSYLSAYVVWMSISLVLYVAGLGIISRRFFCGDPLRQSLIFCFSLGFCPFLVGTLINGQLSAIGFFALTLAIREDERRRLFLSGLALSLCAYKPTLLVLILPMLLVTKRFKTLLGFGVGALALVVSATAIEGVQVWGSYLDLLREFEKIRSLLRLQIYIDLRSFTFLLWPAHAWIILAAVWGFASCAAIRLFLVWRSSLYTDKTVTGLLWATTISWTLLLNVYVPVYDSILVVISVVATARTMKKYAGRFFVVLCVLIFGSTWITVQIAERTGIQILTILLAVLGVLQLYACERELVPSGQIGLKCVCDQRQEEGVTIVTA